MSEPNKGRVADPRDVLILVEALERQIQEATSHHIKCILLESGCALMDAVIAQQSETPRAA